jgi:hypothetical protein
VTENNYEDVATYASRLAWTLVDTLIARNKRLRRLFLFDAQQMMLSLMCADWCGVVWPYLLDGDAYTDGITIREDDVATVRAEFAAVDEERRRRGAAVERHVAAAYVDGGINPA